MEGLTKAFRVGGRPFVAVDHVSFEIERGSTFGVVGESGSGKSTLSRCILCLIPPDAGRVLFDGTVLSAQSPRALRQMRRRLQVVLQDPHGSLNRRLSVAEIISAPLSAHRVGNKVDRTRRVRELLELVGMSESFAARLPRDLSGGQAQRVAIARALALEPDFVVLDEAVSALDVSVRAQILNLLRRLQDELHLTYLFITHDLSVARYMSHQLAVMYRGQFLETGPRSVLFADPAHPYTRSLMSAIPVAGRTPRVGRSPMVVGGGDESESLQITGCRYRARCEIGHDLAECQQVDPGPTSLTPRHTVHCHHPELRSAGATRKEQ
ncbi:MAG: ATP-binding cassette domain-containing protein [Actinomycetota bacterium]|nr:ATP-binding cassette domain-containing protein [Actinomycetota bacterium]